MREHRSKNATSRSLSVLCVQKLIRIICYSLLLKQTNFKALRQNRVIDIIIRSRKPDSLESRSGSNECDTDMHTDDVIWEQILLEVKSVGADLIVK